jgi:RimJ/RimL family protein N-acetyltransferase
MPDIRTLEPGDEAALEAFALPRIETSMFLLGNSRTGGLSDHSERFQGTYAAAFEGERITGVAAHFWNGNVVVNAPHHLSALWRAAVAASRRGVKGVIGPAEHVAAVMRDLAIVPDAAVVQMHSVENLYALELRSLIVPPALAARAVTARPAEPRDAEQLARWRCAFEIETLNERETPQLLEARRQAIANQIRERRMWIAEADGRPAAMTGFNTTTREAVQVGSVFTPVEQRGRGYARAAVAQSLLDAREDGVGKAILFTGEDNIAAQRAYSALGFQHIGDYCILLLRAPINIPS